VDGYLISKELAQRLKASAARVDGMAEGTRALVGPSRFEAIERRIPVVRVAAFPRDTFWRKNETQEVTFYTHNGTEYGPVSTDGSGTATAVNLCNDLPPIPTGIDDPRLGPTPTMTWCVTSILSGGTNVVVEGPQSDTFVSAYPTEEGEWGTGQTRTVSYYHRVGGTGEFIATGFTAQATNIGSPYKPLSTGDESGPSPTMAWCVVASAPDGGLVAVEAQAAPQTQWATIDPAAISDGWPRTSVRPVQLPGSDETVDVVSVFDHYSPIDLPHGLVFTRAKDPNSAEGTANVVIGPPPIPLHSAQRTSEGDWPQDETRELTVLPTAGITQQRSVLVSNPYFDTIESSDRPMAIGKVGTAYHVISAPTSPGVKLGTKVDDSYEQGWDNPWPRNATRSVRITGTTSVVDVLNVFDHFSHLDAPHGLAFVKSKDGEGNTVNVVISPAPIPLHAARPQTTGEWVKGSQKILVVDEQFVTVSNPYFDNLEIDPGRPMAIGKVGEAYHVITAPTQPGVKLATRVEFGDKDTPWMRTSERAVTIMGSTNEVMVTSVFDHYSHLDVPFGLSYVKAADPNGSGEMVNVVIGPPPIPLHLARPQSTGNWARDEEKVLVVPPTPGIPQSRVVNVSNPYFDDVEIDPEKPVAIGKVGTAHHLITPAAQPGVKLGTKVDDSYAQGWDNPWPRNATRSVRITGTTSEVDVVNVFDHYSHLDLPHGLAFVKSKDDSGNTANVVIGPAPIPLHSAKPQTSGKWARNSQRIMVVPPATPGGDERFVNVSNPYFDNVDIDPQKPMAIGKVGTAFHLITSPGEPGVQFADRTESGQWERNSRRSVRLFGTTVTQDAYNLAGSYESFDGRGTGGAPGLVLGKGPDIGGGPGTALYVISPPPSTFRTGTFTGQWTKGSSRSIALTTAPTGTITVINNFGTVGSTASSSSTKNCAMSKEGSQWYLVAAECE
jgi:hypothetical protein